jgi:hypothetical protein
VEGSREVEEKFIVCLLKFKLNQPGVRSISNTYKLANVTLLKLKSKTGCKLKGERETSTRKEEDIKIKVKICKFIGGNYHWGEDCSLKTIHRGYNYVYCERNFWRISYTVKKEDGKFGKNISVSWEKMSLVKSSYFCPYHYSVCNAEWRNYYTVRKADGINSFKKLTSHLGIISGICIVTLVAYIVKNSVNSESINCKMSNPESTPTPMDLDPFPPLGTKVEKPRGMRSVFYVISCIKWS